MAPAIGGILHILVSSSATFCFSYLKSRIDTLQPQGFSTINFI